MPGEKCQSIVRLRDRICYYGWSIIGPPPFGWRWPALVRRHAVRAAYVWSRSFEQQPWCLIDPDRCSEYIACAPLSRLQSVSRLSKLRMLSGTVMAGATP